MSIPPSTDVALANTLRQMQAKIDRLEAAALSPLVDLRGRRFVNSNDGIDPTDFVTVRQLAAVQRQAANSGPEDTVQTLDVTRRLRVLGALLLPGLQDAGVLFVTSDGSLATDADGIAYHYTNGSLILGPTGKFRGHHSVELTWPTTPGVSCVLVIAGEDANATTPIIRIAVGQDTAGHPALVPNGANLEIREAGGGALSEVSAKKFNPASPQTYSATNVTTDRSYDADATTVDELADVLGTLLVDLRAAGLVL